VKSDETACPFCQAVVGPRGCTGRCFGPPEVRFGRAALVAAGAALLGVACQSTNVFPPYGTPPHLDGGGQIDRPSDAVDQADGVGKTDGGLDTGAAKK
jgi:hypothetical protein